MGTVTPDTFQFVAHETLREGQMQMIHDGNEALEKEGYLFAAAPTGIGKTAAALSSTLTYAFNHPEGEKKVLIDSSHEKFKNIWLQVLQGQIDPKTIDFLVVSHTEPDHSGLISDILDLNNNIEIFASKVAIVLSEVPPWYPRSPLF